MVQIFPNNSILVASIFFNFSNLVAQLVLYSVQTPTNVHTHSHINSTLSSNSVTDYEGLACSLALSQILDHNCKSDYKLVFTWGGGGVTPCAQLQLFRLIKHKPKILHWLSSAYCTPQRQNGVFVLQFVRQMLVLKGGSDSSCKDSQFPVWCGTKVLSHAFMFYVVKKIFWRKKNIKNE